MKHYGLSIWIYRIYWNLRNKVFYFFIVFTKTFYKISLSNMMVAYAQYFLSKKLEFEDQKIVVD